jgi:hypothetical protein
MASSIFKFSSTEGVLLLDSGVFLFPMILHYSRSNSPSNFLSLLSQVILGGMRGVERWNSEIGEDVNFSDFLGIVLNLME